MSFIHWLCHLFRMNSTTVRTSPQRDRLQQIREMYVRIFWSSGDAGFNPCRKVLIRVSHMEMLILHYDLKSMWQYMTQNYIIWKSFNIKKQNVSKNFMTASKTAFCTFQGVKIYAFASISIVCNILASIPFLFFFVIQKQYVQVQQETLLNFV